VDLEAVFAGQWRAAPPGISTDSARPVRDQRRFPPHCPQAVAAGTREVPKLADLDYQSLQGTLRASGGARTGCTRAEFRETQHGPGRAVLYRHGGVTGRAGPSTRLRRNSPATIAHSSLCAARLKELVAGKRVHPVDLTVTYGEEGRLLAAYVSRHARDDACACADGLVNEYRLVAWHG